MRRYVFMIHDPEGVWLWNSSARLSDDQAARAWALNLAAKNGGPVDWMRDGCSVEALRRVQPQKAA